MCFFGKPTVANQSLANEGQKYHHVHGAWKPMAYALQPIAANRRETLAGWQVHQVHTAHSISSTIIHDAANSFWKALSFCLRLVTGVSKQAHSQTAKVIVLPFPPLLSLSTPPHQLQVIQITLLTTSMPAYWWFEPPAHPQGTLDPHNSC